MSPDSLCRWQAVYMYMYIVLGGYLRNLGTSNVKSCCTLSISASYHVLCVVVGPGIVLTSLAFMRSSASHTVGPHSRPAKNTVNRVPIAGVGIYRHNLYSSL